MSGPFLDETGLKRFKDLLDAQGGAVSIARQTTVASAVLAAGATVSVPVHAVDSAKLQVYIDGVLTTKDSSYKDASTTSITLVDAYPAGTVIDGVVIQNATDPSADTAALLTTVNAFSNRITTLENDDKDHASSISAQADRITALESTSSSHATDIKSLQTALSDLTTRVAALYTAQSDHQADIDAAYKQLGGS